MIIDPATRAALADRWLGEGRELADRILEFADILRGERLDSATKSDVADDLMAIIKGEWDPNVQPR